MKVKDLIEQLQKFNPEQIVITDGYESGYDEVKEVKYIAGLKHYPRNENDKNWYDGEYQEVNSIGWLQDSINAVYLPRSS